MSERVRKARKKETANEVPPIVQDVLSSSGQPLNSDARDFMEPRFGHDFSQVRVHTDERAVESAEAVNALAYTVGQDVVFGQGQYAPETSEGKKLLAHELTHVVQQEIPLISEDLKVSQPTDMSEIEAENIAQCISQGPLPTTKKQNYTSATAFGNGIPVGSRTPMTIARKSPAEENNIPDEEKSSTRVSSYQPEENVPLGGVEATKEEPNEQVYRVIGFDIGSADVSKPGIKEGLDPIIEDLLAVNDAAPRVEIIGLASESRLKGKDGFTYGHERASTLKKYFVEKGIRAAWITINSLGSVGAPSADSSPMVKAYWRAAIIKISLTGRPRPSKQYKGGFAPDVPPPLKQPGLLSLIPPTSPVAAIRVTFKTMIRAVKELGYANQAGKMEMFRHKYLSAYADAMADLTEADPKKRRLDYYKNEKRIEMGELEGLRLSAIDDPKSLDLLLNAVKSTAGHDALDWVISIEQSEYENWAHTLLDMYPDHDTRRQALYKQFEAFE